MGNVSGEGGGRVSVDVDELVSSPRFAQTVRDMERLREQLDEAERIIRGRGVSADAAYAAGRRAGLEEAAKVCEQQSRVQFGDMRDVCAAAIRRISTEE
jgi:hypothetical protein